VNAYGCQLKTDDKDEQRYINSLLWGELIEEEELEEEVV